MDVRLTVAFCLLGGCAAAVWMRRRWVVAVVRGQSMMPTFVDGQRVLTRRAVRGRIRVGDVIVFRVRSPVTPPVAGTPWYRIKRVVAVAGDPLPAWLPGGPSATVPAGHLVVTGDNPNSEDSRHFGPVRESAVLGVLRRGSG